MSCRCLSHPLFRGFCGGNAAKIVHFCNKSCEWRVHLNKWRFHTAFMHYSFLPTFFCGENGADGVNLRNRLRCTHTQRSIEHGMDTNAWPSPRTIPFGGSHWDLFSLLQTIESSGAEAFHHVCHTLRPRRFAERNFSLNVFKAEPITFLDWWEVLDNFWG